jgi:hypothetical protein
MILKEVVHIFTIIIITSRRDDMKGSYWIVRHKYTNLEIRSKNVTDFRVCKG